MKTTRPIPSGRHLNPDRPTLGIDGLVLRDRAVSAAHL